MKSNRLYIISVNRRRFSAVNVQQRDLLLPNFFAHKKVNIIAIPIPNPLRQSEPKKEVAHTCAKMPPSHFPLHA